jgi:chromosome partitioning protein
MQCEYFALEGLSDLIKSVRVVHSNFNANLSKIGLLRVMFDPRVTLSQDVSAQLIEHFGSKVFSTIIPKNVRLAEAPSHGLPVTVYDSKSRGSMAYKAFGEELINRYNPI